MNNLLNSLNSYDRKQDYVLAIIMATEGSTYRKTGAMMLLDTKLNYWGLLSGGCLEGDIQAHAMKVLADGEDSLIRYDMRDEIDLIWGMGLGCDGALNVLLKFLPANRNQLGFFEVLQRVADGQDHLLIIDQKHANQVKFIALKKRQRQLELRLDEQNPDLKTTIEVPSNCLKIEQHQQLLIPLKAPLNLLICGASPDVPPVTALAAQLGWKTTVIDHRAEFTNANHFAFANQVILQKRSQWASFQLNQFDAAVIMSHQFERDQQYLARLLDSAIPYIGLLGPSKRRDKLLLECGSQFEQHQGRLFAPVGLDIGADDPATIALAIISEIQAVQANKAVGFCYQDSSR